MLLKCIQMQVLSFEYYLNVVEHGDPFDYKEKDNNKDNKKYDNGNNNFLSKKECNR